MHSLFGLGVGLLVSAYVPTLRNPLIAIAVIVIAVLLDAARM